MAAQDQQSSAHGEANAGDERIFEADAVHIVRAGAMDKFAQ